MERPRGGEWLADEIGNLKKQNVTLLVSLLEKEEINELGLQHQETICKSSGIDFINFPIVDRDIPRTNDKTDRLVDFLMNKLQGGSSVVIHCRMGIGRSSIIAASVLLRAGLKAENIIDHISKIRGLKVPDTDKQLQWLKARQ
ncbi:MAG: dual specificity protein phosphatase family protein [Flavisolibacter sp.]